MFSLDDEPYEDMQPWPVYCRLCGADVADESPYSHELSCDLHPDYRPDLDEMDAVDAVPTVPAKEVA